MLTLKYLMMILGVGLFGSAGSLLAYDIYIAAQRRRLLRRNTTDESGVEVGALSRATLPLVQPPPVRWRLAGILAVSALLPLLLALSVIVIPDGAAGVRISQIWGPR